jgi:hypothetical protein
MYQVSRAIYRELSRDIEGGRSEHEAVLRACEATVERMVCDRHYFARPARALFRDIRPHFDIAAWPRVWLVVQGYVACANELIERMPRAGVDVHGNPLRCLHANGYCPSHQHLAETEEVEVAVLEPIAA